MISIPRRFLVSAMPVDGGERVTGYYVCVAGLVSVIYTGKIDLTTIRTTGGITWVRVEIDPDTIEPVKARVIETESYEQCPNCKSNNISFMRTNDYGHPPEPFQCDYCPDCGQALDGVSEKTSPKARLEEKKIKIREENKIISTFNIPRKYVRGISEW